jgi:hypothetical protein
MTCEREVGRNAERCSQDTRKDKPGRLGLETYTVVATKRQGARDA